MDKYSVLVRWSEEDKGYIAVVPELSGLSAFGTSQDEAIKELEVAKALYLEVHKEDGCTLPEPDVVKHYSGQLRLRLPKSLHRRLSEEASREGISLNSYLLHLLSEANAVHRLEQKVDGLIEEFSDSDVENASWAS